MYTVSVFENSIGNTFNIQETSKRISFQKLRVKPPPRISIVFILVTSGNQFTAIWFCYFVYKQLNLI